MPFSVSVILPVFNGEAFLLEALESLAHQSRVPDEVLVIDDGSTDSSRAVAERFARENPQLSVKVFNQGHVGVWAARNFGVSQAVGQFVAFQDADDRSTPHRFSNQAAMLESNPELDLSFGMFEEFGNVRLKSGSEEQVDEESLSKELLGICPGVLMARRAALLRIGPFETKWKLASFIEWYLRAKLLGAQIATSPEVLLHRRIHENNSGILHRDCIATEYSEVFRIHLKRVREAKN